MFQSLVWWIRGFKFPFGVAHSICVQEFQSLVWWIRGFKFFGKQSGSLCVVFQSLVWWIRGFKLLYFYCLYIQSCVSILGLVDKGF